MRYSVLILCLIIVTVASSSTRCTRKSESCTESIECCSRYCRLGGCRNFGDVPDDRGFKNPCGPNTCKSGETCVLQVVQCLRFPCPPIAHCHRE